MRATAFQKLRKTKDNGEMSLIREGEKISSQNFIPSKDVFRK